MARWRALSVLALSVALGTTVSGPVSAAPTLDRDDVSLNALMNEPLDGRDLQVRRELSRTSEYTRYAVSYRGGGQLITGIMNVPRGTGPFPVVVLAHGYIDPQAYWSGQGFRREQDALARNGYVALHVDYRNHAGSSDDPDNDLTMRLGYAEDVLNAAVAVRASNLPTLDGERIAVLGRSMGGSVAFNALVARPGVFDAAVVYASTSTTAVENFNRWQREDDRLRRAVFAEHGSPSVNPGFWRGISAVNYVDRITEPVLMFHGTRDESCPIRWARATRDALVDAGVDVRLVEYPGAGHYMYGEWADSMRRSLAFLGRHLA
jgi:dipeptidyl aminopeptidase/acylaminoacyl peptidase